LKVPLDGGFVVVAVILTCFFLSFSKKKFFFETVSGYIAHASFELLSSSGPSSLASQELR
jgi:hypothetical protein